MPLSEEELRLLEQMERALAAEDPKFASTLEGRSLHRAVRTRLILAVLAFPAGIAALMVGAANRLIWLSALGFIIMVAAAVFGLSAWRGRHLAGHADGGGHSSQAGPDESAGSVGHPSQHSAPKSIAGFELLQGGRAKGRAGKAPWRRRPRRQEARRQGRSQGSFMERVEQRWQRRRDQGGQF